MKVLICILGMLSWSIQSLASVATHFTVNSDSRDNLPSIACHVNPEGASEINSLLNRSTRLSGRGISGLVVDAPKGTRLLVDGSEIYKSDGNIRAIFLPENEYLATFIMPDDTRLEFNFLKGSPAHDLAADRVWDPMGICLLRPDEIRKIK